MTMSDFGRIYNAAAEVDEIQRCRLCGQYHKPVYYIFSNNNGQNLANKIREIWARPVSPDDTYSDFLCLSCVNGVNVAFELLKLEQLYQLQQMGIPPNALYPEVPEDAADNSSQSSSLSSASWCSCSNPSSSPSSSSSGEEGEDNQ